MDPKLILGMTCATGNCITGNLETGLIAYAASNTVVLFNTVLTKQIGYLQGSRQAISCVSFSSDATHLLTGHIGLKPPVHVWNVAKKAKIASLHGHDCGVRCVAFSPKFDVIVSIGNKFDGFVFVWAWPHQHKIACNRFSDEIKSMSYDPNSQYFVTCGVHHIKFWYPEAICNTANEEKSHAPHGPVLMKDMFTLYGRPALLEHVKTATFISIACGCKSSANLIFAVSTDGFMCRLSATRTVQYVECLEVTHLSSICVYDDLLIAGSACGNVFFFDSLTMKFKCSMSFPVDMYFMKQAKRSSRNWPGGKTRCHQELYLFYDGKNKHLTAISMDGSLCVWDVTDLKKYNVKYFTNSHERSISDSQVFQTQDQKGKEKDCLVTVSHDATIRLWDLKIGENIGCKHVRTIYTELTDQTTHDDSGKNVITATAVNESLVASGNSDGRILVYSLKTLQKVTNTIQGHERGITCLTFCNFPKRDNEYLLSGSRDRLINIYDAFNDFSILNTLNIHSGSLTSIGTKTLPSHTILVSTALDRSLVISQSRGEKNPTYTVKFNRFMSSSVVSFVFYEDDQQILIVAGTRIGGIYVMPTNTCTIERSFRASHDPRAHLEILSLQEKNNIVLAACSDRSINILNFQDGSLLKTMTGHGSALSGIYFFKNNNYFVSTSKDGCAFIWDLPTSITESKTADYPKKSGLEINVITRETLLGHAESTPDNWSVSSGHILIMSGSKVTGPELGSIQSISSLEPASSSVSIGENLETEAEVKSRSSFAFEKADDVEFVCAFDNLPKETTSCIAPSSEKSFTSAKGEFMDAYADVKELQGDLKMVSESVHSPLTGGLTELKGDRMIFSRNAKIKRGDQEDVKCVLSEESFVTGTISSRKRRRSHCSPAILLRRTRSAKTCL